MNKIKRNHRGSKIHKTILRCSIFNFCNEKSRLTFKSVRRSNSRIDFNYFSTILYSAYTSRIKEFWG